MTWRDFVFTPLPMDNEDKEDKAVLVYSQGTTLSSLSSEQQIKQSDSDLTSDDPNSLSYWIARVRAARTPEAVLAIVDEFRPGSWSDEQRAEISRCYIGRLERVGYPKYQK